MGIIIIIGLIGIAIALFVAVRKGWIHNETLQTLANVATVVALIAAILVFVVRIPTPPEDISSPQVTSTPSTQLSAQPSTTMRSTTTPSLTQLVDTLTPEQVNTPSPIASPTSMPSLTTTPMSTATLPEDSVWHGEYFGNTEFHEPPAYEGDDAVIAFDWGEANPAPNVPVDNFSIRWTRCPNFEERYYTFNASADDNFKVYVDDTKILDLGLRSAEQKFFISAGRHCLKLEFIEYQGKASVYFDFKASEQPTPVTNTDTWLGEFFANTEFRSPSAYSRNDAFISSDWGNTNPAPAVPLDNFSIRWRRCFNFEDRYYTFTGDADDSLKVYLDDTKILDIGLGGGEQKFFVSAGRHCLRVDFIEYQGEASVYFDFK